MKRLIRRRTLGDLPQGWYPFSARPIVPELENRVLEDLGDTWTRRLPELLTEESSANPFSLRIWPERLNEPAGWRTPSVVLVGGGADPFDSTLDPGYLRQMFRSMIAAPEHVFVVLTGRVDRAAIFLRSARSRGLPLTLPGNIAVGTPDGHTPAEHARVELLSALPVRHRFALETPVKENSSDSSLFSA